MFRQLYLVAILMGPLPTLQAQALPEKSTLSPAAEGEVDFDTVTLIMPVQISRQALSSGCWAQFFDQKDFKGRAITVLGPSEFKAYSKAIGLQSGQAEAESLVTGPHATLTVYQRENLQDKSAQFRPQVREPELRKKIGFAGRIESLKIDCAPPPPRDVDTSNPR